MPVHMRILRDSSFLETLQEIINNPDAIQTAYKELQAANAFTDEHEAKILEAQSFLTNYDTLKADLTNSKNKFKSEKETYLKTVQEAKDQQQQNEKNIKEQLNSISEFKNQLEAQVKELQSSLVAFAQEKEAFAQEKKAAEKSIQDRNAQIDKVQIALDGQIYRANQLDASLKAKAQKLQSIIGE